MRENQLSETTQELALRLLFSEMLLWNVDPIQWCLTTPLTGYQTSPQDCVYLHRLILVAVKVGISFLCEDFTSRIRRLDNGLGIALETTFQS